MNSFTKTVLLFYMFHKKVNSISIRGSVLVGTEPFCLYRYKLFMSEFKTFSYFSWVKDFNSECKRI